MKILRRTRSTIRSGFTLVELVVVVLVLGILASVATPKLFDSAGDARDSGLRQTLKVVRDANELYRASNDGAFPGAGGGSAVFKTDLGPYIMARFPAAPVGPKDGARDVKVETAGTPLTGNSTPAKAWRYDKTTGEFILNFDGVSDDGVTPYDEF